MRNPFRIVSLLVALGAAGVYAWSQSTPATTSPTPQSSVHQENKHSSPGKEVGKGGEDISKGVAKGTGELAKGTGGAVANLAHGNVGGAGASFGKGVAGLGKNVTMGTGKGMGKIAKGIGGALKKL